MTVHVHFPPNAPAEGLRPDLPSVFLAGTIEQGASRDWQGMVTAALRIGGVEANVYNPRRAHWDPSWEQSPDNPEFSAQVTWEMQHIHRSDVVAFNFEPDTLSPITLLELGLVCGDAREYQKVIVCCPPGYWRRGNVQMVCSRYGVPLVASLEELGGAVAKALRETVDEDRAYRRAASW